jgi:hypothetical protein
MVQVFLFIATSFSYKGTLFAKENGFVFMGLDGVLETSILSRSTSLQRKKFQQNQSSVV